MTDSGSSAPLSGPEERTVRRPLELDDQSLNAFIVARGLLERGTLGQDGTAPGAIAAVILYDVAVETAAKAAVRARPPSNFPGSGYVVRPAKRSEQQKEYLPWVLDQLLASYRELLRTDQGDSQALRDARTLHDYRNLVQHQGTVPSLQDVDRQRFRATDFIGWVTRGFFDRELHEVSRAILIKDKDVRNSVEEAEQSLVAGDLTSAAEKLSIAFEAARHAFRSDQPFSSQKSIRGFDVSNAVSDLKRSFQAAGRGIPILNLRHLEQLLQTLVLRSDRVEDRLEALSLGAEASDYAWFRNRFPRAHGPYNQGQWHVSWPTGSERLFTPEEVMRGMEFVTTVALHWQQFPSPGLEDRAN
jgi:hypothetical protein